MIKHLLLLVCMTFFAAMTLQAQTESAVPPPLAFSDFNADETEYHLYDFATEEVTTIARTGGVTYGEFGGEMYLPDEVLLQAPYDPALQVLFINETGQAIQGEESYHTVYLVLPNGERKLIVEDGLPSQANWSPNGRYFYFMGDYRQNAYTLYQYSLDTGDMTSLLQIPSGTAPYCHPETEWCIVKHIAPEPGRTALSLLDTNTGRHWLVATISGNEGVWWQDGAPAIYYVVPLANKGEALRRYDYAQHSDTLLAEVDARDIRQLTPSPDERWLAFTADTGTHHDLFVLDTEQTGTTPLLLTGEVDLSIGRRFLRWRSPNALFYDAFEPPRAIGGKTNFGFYHSTLPDGTTHPAAEFSLDADLMDQAWSPDGRWLAVSYGFYGDENALYVVDSFAEAPLRQIPVDFPPTALICVGWYTPEVSASGEANLCNNIYTGIG